MHENKTEKLLKIIAELRDPVSGCEWTKSQTSKTLLPFIIEEAKEVQDVSFSEVVDNLCEKLIRRHPYVFEDKRPHTIEEQREAYFKIKEFEKSK